MQITIHGKTYNVKADSPSVDMEELAAFVDSKMGALSQAKFKPSTVDLAILTALNIAQDLFELRREFEDFKQRRLQELEEPERKVQELTANLERELLKIKTGKDRKDVAK